MRRFPYEMFISIFQSCNLLIAPGIACKGIGNLHALLCNTLAQGRGFVSVLGGKMKDYKIQQQ